MVLSKLITLYYPIFRIFLLPLVNRESYLANSHAEYSQAGNPSKDEWKKEVESENRQHPMKK